MLCKRVSVIAGAALMAAGFVCGSMVTSTMAGPDDKNAPTHKDGVGAPSVDQQAMMDAWMKAATPGTEHAEMAKRVGKWTVTMKHWEDPSQPPQVSEGTATMKMIMDGRYLVENFEGTSMGMPFKGMGISCYDNIDKKHKTVWLDNFSTGMMLMEGDRAGAVQTAYGTFKDPMGATQTMKVVSTEKDPSNCLCEFFMKSPDGKWWKNMELTYARAQ